MVISERKFRAMDLLDFKDGTIRRELFNSPELHQIEAEKVFTRAWLFVGHESQIPNPNDFFVSRMGTESVIMTRDRQGQINVLLNTCRHRGMKVCRYDQGNTPVFSCPYHGWSYSTDGKLVTVPGELIGVPQLKSAYFEELEREKWGMINAPKVFNYKRTIWACWDEQAPEFLDYIGDFKVFLDALLDHRTGREGGSVVVGGVQKWRVPCNWKFESENSSGDMYHGISHQSVELVGIGPGGQVAGGGGASRQGGSRRFNSRGIISFPELGHCVRGGPPHIEENYPFPEFHSPLGPLDDMEAVDAYFKEVFEQRKRILANQAISWSGGHIFPNFSFHAMFPRDIAIVHPVGPTEMEMWRWSLVDEDAPKAVVDLARHHYLRYVGPGGMTEQDDMENWNYASAASNGPVSRRYPYNYQQGLGHSMPVPGLEGAILTESTVSEENARTMYRRWAQFMDAESWDDLRQNSATPG